MALRDDIRRLTRAAAALALAAAASALPFACTSTADDELPGDDAGALDGTATRTDCPEQEPAAGAACALPEGTTCGFGKCGTRLARCTLGAWEIGANPAPRPPCPEVPPSQGQACAPCWPPEMTCTYGSTDCSAEDASVNTAVASCPNETWVLSVRPCRDGGLDGGPDVQGDSGLDAD